MEIEDPQIQKTACWRSPKDRGLHNSSQSQVKILHRDVKPAWGSPGRA